MYAPLIAVNPKQMYNRFVTYMLTEWIAYYFPKNILISKTLDLETHPFSHDKEMQQFMQSNPLIFPYTTPRPRTAAELVLSGQFVQANASCIGDTDIPILVFHGDADPTTVSSIS